MRYNGKKKNKQRSKLEMNQHRSSQEKVKLYCTIHTRLTKFSFGEVVEKLEWYTAGKSVYLWTHSEKLFNPVANSKFIYLMTQKSYSYLYSWHKRAPMQSQDIYKNICFL